MIKIGDKVEIIDKRSEFYGLTLVVIEIRTESNPRQFQVYLCQTIDGLPPEGYPFSRKDFREDQIRFLDE